MPRNSRVGYATDVEEARQLRGQRRAMDHLFQGVAPLQSLDEQALPVLEYLIHIAPEDDLVVARDEAVGEHEFRAWLADARGGAGQGQFHARWLAARKAWSAGSDWTAVSFPRVVSICIWEKQCFAKCRFCPQIVHPDRVAHRTMDFDLYRRIIDQLPESLPLTLRVAVDGESLSFSEIHRYVRYARDALPNATIEYATNGIPLNERRGAQIIESGLDHLMVSVNCPDRESYQWFTGPDAYDRVLSNLRSFQKLKARLGVSRPMVSAKIMTLQRWADQIDPALAQLRQVVDQALPSHVHYYDSGDLENIAEWHKPESPMIPTCTYLSYILSIMPDGSCDVCCASNFFKSPHPDLGNAADTPLADIWNSTTYQELRQENAQGRAAISACHNCNVDLTSPEEDLRIKARQRDLMHLWGQSKGTE